MADDSRGGAVLAAIDLHHSGVPPSSPELRLDLDDDVEMTRYVGDGNESVTHAFA